MSDDEWGRDPAVRSMRRVFAAIDARQVRLLHGLGIDRFDRRLGQWRKMALSLFERRWAEAARAGSNIEEKDIADLYLYCLARVVASRGVSIPAGALPDNAAVLKIMEEKR